MATIQIQGENMQRSTAYEPTPECPQEIKVKGKNLFDGGERVMNDSSISGFTIDNNINNVRINDNCAVRISGVTLASNYVMKEEKKVNKFLEIKEGQEIDKIEEKYREEKEALIAVDRINKILLETKEKINKIYEEERNVKRFYFDIEYNITKETREKIEELREEKNGKIAAIKEKYAEVAALVEDMPASERIKIYERYEIL